MKISSSLVPFKNFNRSLILTFITSIAVGTTAYLSLKLLTHIGLIYMGIATSSSQGNGSHMNLANTIEYVFLGGMMYALIATFTLLSIVLSNLVGLLMLRLLKVDHSVKIVIMSLIILLTISLVDAMLSYIAPPLLMLIVSPVVAYLISIFTIKILVDRQQHTKHPKLPPKIPPGDKENTTNLR